MKPSLLLFLIPVLAEAGNYSARRVTVDSVEVIRLSDAAHRTEVSIVPSAGNIAYEMLVNGKNVLWTPFERLSELKAKPVLCGIPFLAPWANRIDQDTYYVNGTKFVLNPEIRNFRRDSNGKPIHGLLAFSPLWKVVSLKADGQSAEVTSRLEFWRYPELMAQFPFAHTIEMSYSLRDGALEVVTVLENLSAAPMPVAVGYHPYFQLHDAPRDQWKVHLAARDHLVLSKMLIPTGERTPVTFPDPVSLGDTQLDDVFSGLVRGSNGLAEFSVEGVKEKISVLYGAKYTVAIAYAPKGQHFICFEPMSAVTDAFNLANAGKYDDLQMIPAGGRWRESFWVKASGF